MDFFDAIRTRRSVRKFKPDPKAITHYNRFGRGGKGNRAVGRAGTTGPSGG